MFLRLHALAALVALTIVILRMHCESSGCIGRGIAWACGHVVVLSGGSVLRLRAARTRWRVVLHGALAVQLAMGLALLVASLLHGAG